MGCCSFGSMFIYLGWRIARGVVGRPNGTLMTWEPELAFVLSVNSEDPTRSITTGWP